MRGCRVPEGRLTITRRFNAESVEQTIPVPKGRLKSFRRRWAPFQACLRCAHLVLSARATEVAGYYRRSLRDRTFIVLPGCQLAACQLLTTPCPWIACPLLPGRALRASFFLPSPPGFVSGQPSGLRLGPAFSAF